MKNKYFSNNKKIDSIGYLYNCYHNTLTELITTQDWFKLLRNKRRRKKHWINEKNNFYNSKLSVY